MNCSGRMPLTPVATTVIPSLSKRVNGPPNRSECVLNPTPPALRQALHESHRRRPASLHFTSATRQRKRSFFYPRDIPSVSTTYPQQMQLASSGFFAVFNLSGDNPASGRDVSGQTEDVVDAVASHHAFKRADRRDRREGRALLRDVSLGSGIPNRGAAGRGFSARSSRRSRRRMPKQSSYAVG